MPNVGLSKTIFLFFSDILSFVFWCPSSNPAYSASLILKAYSNVVEGRKVMLRNWIALEYLRSFVIFDQLACNRILESTALLVR